MYPHDDELYDTISDIAGPPAGGKPEAWIYGVIAALPLAAYGLYCLISQHAWFPPIGIRGLPQQHRGLQEHTGYLAMAQGLVWLAVAMYLHFQYFWSQSPRLFRYYEIGRLIALLLFIAALVWWIYEYAHKVF
jgi:hypothetical protein